jgi:hypothetical protein
VADRAKCSPGNSGETWGTWGRTGRFGKVITNWKLIEIVRAKNGTMERTIYVCELGRSDR